MVSRRLRRAVFGTVAPLVAVLTVGGCVSMPSAGPVESYAVTQGPNAQAQPYVQIVTGPPQQGWSPKQIVEGFLTASASFGDNGQVAREYLTPQASAAWNQFGSAVVVYKNGPNVAGTAYSHVPAPKPTAKASASPSGHATSPPPETATVTISGQVQANLSSHGSYAVASASPVAADLPYFELVKNSAGQWRISHAWTQLLLPAYSFANDYQLRNLYFLDPQFRYLVPDPVYVPLEATPATLMGGLVRDLINQPGDWLGNGATKTAFPAGTTLLGDVTLDGVTAVVNLGGTVVHASSEAMQQVSAQLLRTLSGVGQGGQSVQSVEVQRDGKTWMPNDSQDNPVQSTSKYNPAPGANSTFYFLGAGGVVFSQNGVRGRPVEIEQIGTKFDQIAVSRDGQYLAAMTAGGQLFTGPLGGVLAKRGETQYNSISWDPDDDLWATTNTQVVVLLPGNHLVTVSGIGSGVAALTVAPDGVRVAMIIGDDQLSFGAISWQEGPRQGQPSVRVRLSPFSVQTLTSLQAVTWYGPDNVITLADPGQTPSVTEYPVNGGNSTTIPEYPGMQSISASPGSALVAGLSHGHMVTDASLTGTWVPMLTDGTSPVYPG
jgi:Lipoprotein LpqB beta-propeller domain/Sporulation and spore germination